MIERERDNLIAKVVAAGDFDLERAKSEPSTCPNCGDKSVRTLYDIGDGPEFSCVHCEWCWGAAGQPLTSKPIRHLREELERMLAVRPEVNYPIKRRRRRK